jgi:hypothetical protein
LGYGFVTLIFSHGELSAVDGVLLACGLLSLADAHDLDRPGRGRALVRGGSPLVPALNRAVHRAILAGHWLVHGLGQLETIPVYIVPAVMGSRP